MDEYFIGRPGSTPAGQYAMFFSREGGEIESRALVDSQVANEMAFMTGPDSKRVRVDDPVPRRAGDRDTFAVAMRVPIINPNTDETVGIVGCLLFIDAIQPLVQQVISSYDEIGAMTIFAGNGMIMGHMVPERVGRMLLDVETIFGERIHEANRAVLEGRLFEQRTFSPVLNDMVEIAIVPFNIGNSDTNWSVMLVSLESYVTKDIRRITVNVVIVALAALLITALVVIIIISHSTKPIVTITNELKYLSEGDLTRNKINFNSKDEIGLLTSYFNQTVQNIRQMVVEIKGEANGLSQIGTDLSNDMAETAAAMNEITANIQSIKSRMINQSASVTETNSTMEQITVNINKLNSHVQKQADSVADSSSAIEQMLANISSVTQTLIKNGGNVEALTAASEVGRAGLQDVSTDIQEIARESEGLLEINSVMENIASQTNLLSMNAAIEAAHAGEAGKGFAVVADEIRKLAESSSEQSKTISTVLKKIKGSIDKITQSTDNVLKRFEAIDSSVKTVAEQEENIRGAMEEQGQGSKQIMESISHVNETTQLVKSVSLEMLEGAKEVIREANNLEKATQEITGGINEMASGADQVNTAVNHVSELSGKNREAISLLSSEVSRFKVEQTN